MPRPYSAILAAALAITVAGMTSATSATLAADRENAPAQDREPLVAIDRSLFSAEPGDRLTLALVDGVELTLAVEHTTRRPTGVAIQARVVSGAEGTCTLTIEDGLVTAGFWTDRGTFELAPVAPAELDIPALCRARRLDRAEVVRCLARAPAVLPVTPVTPVTPATPARAKPAAPGPLSKPRPDEPAPARGADPCGCPDDQAVIDVLCVYTTLAKTGAGGAANIQARFQNALDAANGAFLNSGFTASGVNRLQVRAAGYAEINYNEVAPQWLNHLERVTAPADGFMDEVHALRDAFKADTVMLIVNDDRFWGGAGWWAIWGPDAAFTCCNWRGLGGGSLTAAHELGHNLGCAHDREHDASAPLSYAWGHYFTHAGQTYGDIMSYVGDVPLQAYSNPHLIHAPSGQPMGVPPGQPRAAYNAYVINQTRWTLANYRDAARITDCNGNGADDALDIASGASLDANANCRPDECELRRYVDADIPGFGEGSSWSTATRDLGEIIDIANLGCSGISQIWAADGTYTPDSGTADRYRNVRLRSGLALYGGFQGRSRPGGGETSLNQRNPVAFTSTLSGAIGTPGASDNSYSVVYALSAGPTAILDGFTIRDGYTDFSGAGVFLDASSPTIRHCTITANRAGDAAGLVMWNAGPGPATLTDCVFTSNTAATGGGGAMGVFSGASLNASGCDFTGNTAAYGGAISSNDSALSLLSCTLTGNRAVQYNGGAIDLNNNQLVLANSIVAGNTSAQDGGGLWLANATSAAVTNTTIHGNHAGTFTGGAVVYFASATFNNTILWGNTGGSGGQDKQLVYFSSTGPVRYSRVQGWTGSLGGPGSSGADPLLADPASGDYTLLAGSSAIDAADANALGPAITLDVYGEARRVDDPSTPDTGPGPAPALDIGAAEFQPPAACPADLNGDGLVDFGDYLEFLNLYDALDPRVDFNMDGLVDFGDYLEFLNLYDAGC